ncbi:energy-coupling factor transporter transmembrane protein EcfT [Oxobacter pfennigii]|uniref:Energy-coupling factor transporter transmembrane protein EcfT n=1 Tax=Oxobacter pfennigii TaxID=36849 RepID=A0A0P8WKV9_9CLOT|nr:energy-coupling factor transporter transmembrane component T [Oxobacter pfennigii]KPU42997.1 energy-coupling factor transporter transmembrane protein EcfT [Oxobacter pfennigii]
MIVSGRTQGINPDPRTKLFLLLMVILAAAMSPSLSYELGLVVLIAVFGVFCGGIKYSLISAFAYGLIYIFTLLVLDKITGGLRTTFIAFLGLVHKVYPCGMLAGIMISTTKVSEFMSAMYRIRAPKKLVIPLAVMLRYLPAVREDWSYIKDAMRMRDVSPSLKGLITRPAMTMECVYVPLMMSASKAADELSVAAVTRGIENPKPRTCLTQILFGVSDLVLAACFLLYFMAGRFI